MSYKNKERHSTGIHTKINDYTRVSSAWRTYSNPHFESRAWETFLWVNGEIKETYNPLKNADEVIDLHQKISEEYQNVKIPQSFEFYHKTEPELIYVANLEPDELYMIEWESNGKKDGEVYIKEEVEHYIKNDIWVII